MTRRVDGSGDLFNRSCDGATTPRFFAGSATTQKSFDSFGGGQNPNNHWLVREEASDDGRAQLATPLEAAVKIRRLELVQLLVREGASVSPTVRARLLDLARTADAPDIVDYLRAASDVTQ